ncbi:MAG: NAD-dependent epimerase/dehydratase family protein [Myxococcales bacterium]
MTAPASNIGRRVLVTGAAGELGSRLVKRLRDDGWLVRGLVLPGDPLAARLAGLGAEVVTGDVRAPRTLDRAVSDVDTVFHVAAVILASEAAVLDQVNRQGTANMLAASVAAGVRHFVYVSSASVTYPRLTPYGRSKLAAEELVRAETALVHTIVRPTLVYDRDGGEEFMMFVRFLERFPVVPFIGPGTARKSPVAASDVVEGLARIAGNPLAAGRTYNLSGGESITLEELGKLVLELRGRARPFVHLPVWACRVLAALLSLVMKKPPLTQYGVTGFINHADLDCAAATRDLGYRPVGARAGIARCFPNVFTDNTATVHRRAS